MNNNLRLFIKQVLKYKKQHIIAIICLAFGASIAILMPIVNIQILDKAIVNNN